MIKTEKENDDFPIVTKNVKNSQSNNSPLKIKTENENDKFQILTEKELGSDSVEINYLDDSSESTLDLPNLVYLHKGEDSRQALEKSDYESFIEFLQEKIMDLPETEHIKIDWYGYGLHRGNFRKFNLGFQ